MRARRERVDQRDQRTGVAVRADQPREDELRALELLGPDRRVPGHAEHLGRRRRAGRRRAGTARRRRSSSSPARALAEREVRPRRSRSPRAARAPGRGPRRSSRAAVGGADQRGHVAGAHGEDRRLEVHRGGAQRVGRRGRRRPRRSARGRRPGRARCGSAMFARRRRISESTLTRPAPRSSAAREVGERLLGLADRGRVARRLEQPPRPRVRVARRRARAARARSRAAVPGAPRRRASSPAASSAAATVLVGRDRRRRRGATRARRCPARRRPPARGGRSGGRARRRCSTRSSAAAGGGSRAARSPRLISPRGLGRLERGRVEPEHVERAAAIASSAPFSAAAATSSARRPSSSAAAPRGAGTRALIPAPGRRGEASGSRPSSWASESSVGHLEQRERVAAGRPRRGARRRGSAIRVPCGAARAACAPPRARAAPISSRSQPRPDRDASRRGRSRAATIPSAPSRRPANSSASTDALSSHWSSSTSANNGWSPATSASSLRVPPRPRTRSPPSPRHRQRAPSARPADGRSASIHRAPSPAITQGGERDLRLGSIPRTRITRKPAAARLGVSSSAVLPIPASPRTTSAPPWPERAPASSVLIRGYFRVASDDHRRCNGVRRAFRATSGSVRAGSAAGIEGARASRAARRLPAARGTRPSSARRRPGRAGRERDRAVALGQARAVGPDDERDVRVGGLGQAEGAGDGDLAGRGLEQVVAAHDLADPLLGVVDHDGQV